MAVATYDPRLQVIAQDGEDLTVKIRKDFFDEVKDQLGWKIRFETGEYPLWFLEDMEKESLLAKKQGKTYDNVEGLFDDILNDDV